MTSPTNDRPRVEYVDLGETLRRMKAELRREFPGTRFSVTRSRGTGYGYVTVRWTDGPTHDDVAAVTRMYEGEGFDGMTDSSYRIEHTAADGTGAPVVVRYGTRGIHTTHELSPHRRAAAVRIVLRFFGGWNDPARAEALASDPDDAVVLRDAWRLSLNGAGTCAESYARRALERVGRLPDELLRLTAHL